MDKKDYRIVFMGTPEISAYVLESLIKNNFNVVGLISQPDRPCGRKHILSPTPTKVVANKYNIPVIQPIKIRDDIDTILSFKPDVIITLAYGQIVPQSVLDIPTHGCINLHGSLLPKYRGAAPIQYALMNNEKETGMTLMKMVKAMDAGEMYDVEKVNIDNDDNSTSLFFKMGKAAETLILRALPKYMNGELIGVEQDESKVTFAPSIKAEEEKIDFNCKIDEIYGKVRALSEDPGAYALLDNEKLKIFKCIIINRNKGTPGKISKADKYGLYVECIDGTLSLIDVQKQGRSKMNYKDFVNGNKNLLDKILN